jgi:hypothetical protein
VDRIPEQQDLTELFAARADYRREQAKLPIEEKFRILMRMWQMAEATRSERERHRPQANPGTTQDPS